MLDERTKKLIRYANACYVTLIVTNIIAIAASSYGARWLTFICLAVSLVAAISLTLLPKR